jgi:FKBP-type peptidyl-prolyl cis-trans isomerase 2
MMAPNKNILASGLIIVLFFIGCRNKEEEQIVGNNNSGRLERRTGDEKMTITNGSNVKLQYEGRLETGEVFDKSDEENPLQFIVGSGQIIPGFEKAVESMKTGEEKEFTIEPEDAYGIKNENLIREVPRSELPENITPEVGMVLRTQTPSGQSMPVRIVELNEKNVKIDFNHPLAGEKLIFKVKILDVN